MDRKCFDEDFSHKIYNSKNKYDHVDHSDDTSNECWISDSKNKREVNYGIQIHD